MIYEKDITNTEQIGAYHFCDSRQFAICFDVIDGCLHKFTQLRTPPGELPQTSQSAGDGKPPPHSTPHRRLDHPAPIFITQGC